MLLKEKKNEKKENKKVTAQVQKLYALFEKYVRR